MASNAAIKITFSETMNTDSVSAAVSLSSISQGDLTLSWDTTGSVLTITPKHSLSYASGSTAAGTAPIKYTVALTGDAKDLAGNLLPAFSSNFTTLRRITQTIASGMVVTYDSYARATGRYPVYCTADPVSVYQWAGGVSSGTAYVFVPFDISALGSSTNIATIESATLSGAQLAPTGDFYSQNQVMANEVQYHAIDDQLLEAAIVNNLGTFAGSALSQPSISVLSSLKSGLASAVQQEMFRLEPNGNDNTGLKANFTCSGFSLKVVFLTP